jgi:predicted flap endonuclease-1-like 5' DNA nuclease
MRGDFSQLRYSPLDNDQGVLYQQGRVTLDADLSAAELIALNWRSQAVRDVIGNRVAAVPAHEPNGFAIEAAAVAGGQVRLQVRPGRIWADGLLLYLAGDPPDPEAAVERVATYLEPPLNAGTVATIGAGARDAVVLEIALEELNGFQDPLRLIEPALGGPDTSERIAARHAFRLLRLGPGQDCSSILGALADGPAGKGRLSVSLEPALVVAGDCPTVEGGGYTGFEHNLYRVEIAAVNAGAARFKWSQFNGGLVGRGVFQAGAPNRVILTANRAAIVNSGLTGFYLEALQYDAERHHWAVVYGAQATLNSQLDLELNATPVFGTFSFGADPVFFRLWNGIEPIAAFTNAVSPVALMDGIRLVFDAAAAGASYRPGDYWTFSVRAGEIANDEMLIDQQPPMGPTLRRVPLAEIYWTDAQDTTQGGLIDDCRKRFRPLTNQKVCCSLLVGDGVRTFGDFNSLEEAATHLPPGGGDLCLLPGVHFANLTLIGRNNIRITGCRRRTTVLPRVDMPAEPIIHMIDCTGIEIAGLDLISFFGPAIIADGTTFGEATDLRVQDCRMLARTYAVRARRVERVTIARNPIWLLDTDEGRAAIQVRTRQSLIERNSLGVWPVSFNPPPPADGGGVITTQPSDPCANPSLVYGTLTNSVNYAIHAWLTAVAVPPPQPYRAWGGIHLLGGCEAVKLLENRVDGGAGHGIMLGGLLPGENGAETRPDAAPAPSVTVTQNQFLGFVTDEANQPVTGVDVYLRSGSTIAGQGTSSGAQAAVSISVPAGSYTLTLEPGYEIVQLVTAGTGTMSVYGIVVRAVAAEVPDEQGFLYQIEIRENEVVRMALSGIGFGRHAAAMTAVPPTISDPAQATAQLATMLAPQGLLGTTNVVRDLTVAENRIHHNLRAVFDDVLRRESREIGQGGISLGLVENARISGNQVHDNGTTAVNPTCGIFVAYGENVELTGNQVSGNGPLTENYEADRIEGLRGGIVVRFASALLVGGESDAQQKPALRIADNRVDQPAGRALTAFAFGPVSCVGNYLNSERTGRLNVLDPAVGGALILNIGGLHRQQRFTQGSGNIDSFSIAQRAELLLPGGEVLFNSNQVRIGPQNDAFTATLILTMDDVGFDGNQSSVFRPDVLFSNGVCLGFSLRATDNRFREHTENCFFSLVTYSFGLTEAGRRRTMNTTAHNQGDHCILALSNALPGGPPIVDQGNLEANFIECRRALGQRDGQNAVLLQAASASLFAQQPAALNAPNLTLMSRQATADAAASVQVAQLQYRMAYQQETIRLERELSADDPRVLTARARLDRSAAAVRQLAVEAELATINEPATPESGTVFDGRIMDPEFRGRPNLTVELVRADDERVGVAARTDAAGYYAVPLDAERTASLAEEKELFVRVTDEQGTVLHRSAQPVSIAAETPLRTAVTIGREPVPQEAFVSPVVLYRRAEPAAESGRSTPLEHVKGIGPKTAARLRDAGIPDVEALLRTSGERLVEIAGFDADVVRRAAREAIRKSAAADTTPADEASRTRNE